MNVRHHRWPQYGATESAIRAGQLSAAGRQLWTGETSAAGMSARGARQTGIPAHMGSDKWNYLSILSIMKRPPRTNDTRSQVALIRAPLRVGCRGKILHKGSIWQRMDPLHFYTQNPIEISITLAGTDMSATHPKENTGHKQQNHPIER